MARARHKNVRGSNAVPLVGVHRLALAAVLVAGATGIGASGQDTPTAAGGATADASVTYPDRPGGREWHVSRTTPRERLKSEPAGEFHAAKAPKDKPKDLDRRFVTTALNVWTGPGEDNRLLTVLSTGSTVRATGETDGRWAEIWRGGHSRWVNADYLSSTDPEAEDEDDAGSGGGGISDAPCESGSSVEDGLTPDAVRVHRAVCAHFPEVSSYGGLRSDDDEHGTGRALDVMVNGSSLGDRIADWVRANAGALGVSEVIWSQRIWTVQRSSEGWRSMPDRGSATANHYDHVHVTVYGSSGG